MKKDKNSLSVVTDDNKKALKTVKAKKVRKVKVPKQKKGVQWWKKAILVLFFLCCIVGLCGLGFVATVMMQAPPLDTTKFEFTAPTMVYDINGDEYQELEATEKREPVTIEEVPEMVQLAFIAMEDQRFYNHFGVDIRGTGKAIVSVLLTGSTDGPGGSTITQQLIKLTHLTSDTTFTRKFMEWRLAVEAEQQVPKRKIMEAYLNEVNMRHTWGIQSAAKFYFGKDVSELSIAQSAVLVSIINNPVWYDPYDYEEDENGDTYIVKEKLSDGTVRIGHDSDNRERAKLVVEKMYELGHITKKEFEIATDELDNNKIALIPPVYSTTYTYFTDAVYSQVLKDLMKEYAYTSKEAADFILNGGLKIYSTVDPIIQNALEEQAAKSSNFPAQSDSAKTVSKKLTEKKGEKVEYKVQVGGTVIENETGYVAGIIGGREKTGSLSMNRALQQFQIGSTAKPLTVYSPGVDRGILTLATTFNNVRMTFGSWRVVNTPSTYTGMMSVRDAIVGSVNIVAVLAQKKVGVEISAEYGEKFGLEIVREGTYNDLNPSAMALGGYTYGQTPLALTSAYTVFPNGGYRITPTFYTRVEDSNGTVILEADQETVQVISEDTAWLITSCLRGVVRGGTTTRSVPGQQMGGKTGTTDSNTVTWFAGFTPKYTGAFWYGYDEQKVSVDGKTYNLRVGIGGGGSKSPSQFWENTFRQFYDEKNLKNANLPGKPDNVYSAAVDAVSGKAPTDLTEKDPRGSQVKTEYFAKGTYPSEEDDMHQEMDLCVISGLLPNEHCVTEKKVVVVKDKDKLYPAGTHITSSNYGSKEKKVKPPTDVCEVCTSSGTVDSLVFSTRYSSNSPTNKVVVNAGESVTLYVKAVKRDGSVSNLGSETPSLSTRDSAICSVSGGAGGVTITGKSAGTTTVTARVTYFLGTSAEYTVTRSIIVQVK